MLASFVISKLQLSESLEQIVFMKNEELELPRVGLLVRKLVYHHFREKNVSSGFFVVGYQPFLRI